MQRIIYKILAFLYPPNLGKTLGLWVENIVRIMLWPFERVEEFIKRTTKFLQPHIIDFDFDPFGASWFLLTLYLMLFNLSLPALYGIGVLEQSFFIRYLSSSLQYTILLPFSYILRYANAVAFGEMVRNRVDKWHYAFVELAKICFVIFFSGVIGSMFYIIANL